MGVILKHDDNNGKTTAGSSLTLSQAKYTINKYPARPSDAGLLLASLCIFTLLLPAVCWSAEGYQVKGRASWYGTTAHGMRTANGETYNRNALTAAHKKLPFGTVVRVRNLKNNRQVLVRVNDRGPYVKGRIVDLSSRAAKVLKMTRAGVAPVMVEVVATPKGEPLNPDNGFYVHVANKVGTLNSRLASAELEKELNKPVRALPSPHEKQASYAICIGPYPTFNKAQKDFLLLERKQLPLLGIIEAPASRRALPAPAAAAASQSSPAPSVAHDAGPLCPVKQLAATAFARPLHAAPSFAVEQSLLLVAILNTVLPDIASNNDLFCSLHPQLLAHVGRFPS